MDDGALRAIALKPKLKKAIRLGGWVLSLVALAFFLRLAANTGLSFRDRSGLEIVCAAVLGSAIYGAAVGVLSVTWLLLAAPRRSLSFASKIQVVSSYLTSQFAKYLPGNVFQYVARHALGRQLGIAHGTLAAATVLETCLLACAAITLVLLFGVPILRMLFPNLIAFPRWLGLLCVFAVPAAHFLLRYLPAPQWIPRYPLPRLLLALSGYFTFFAFFGGLFWGVLQWVSRANYPPAEILGGSSAAWLVSFAVPGAPAGAGLREAALVFATGATTPTDELLSAIVFFRLITLGGDLLAFLAGWLLPRLAGTTQSNA